MMLVATKLTENYVSNTVVEGASGSLGEIAKALGAVV
jgi:hypothetical protein